MQSRVTNHSIYPCRRIEVVVGVSYDDHIEKAESVIREVIARQPFCMSNPGAVVGVDTLGDSSQTFLVHVWVHSDQTVSGTMQLLREINRAFDNENITIPFPR